MSLALKRGITLAATLYPIICPICNLKLDIFTKVHVEKHGLTKKEFLMKYPYYRERQFWGTVKK